MTSGDRPPADPPETGATVTGATGTTVTGATDTTTIGAELNAVLAAAAGVPEVGDGAQVPTPRSTSPRRFAPTISTGPPLIVDTGLSLSQPSFTASPSQLTSVPTAGAAATAEEQSVSAVAFLANQTDASRRAVAASAAADGPADPTIAATTTGTGIAASFPDDGWVSAPFSYSCLLLFLFLFLGWRGVDRPPPLLPGRGIEEVWAGVACEPTVSVSVCMCLCPVQWFRRMLSKQTPRLPSWLDALATPVSPPLGTLAGHRRDGTVPVLPQCALQMPCTLGVISHGPLPPAIELID
jgi:hypothetical protein